MRKMRIELLTVADTCYHDQNSKKRKNAQGMLSLVSPLSQTVQGTLSKKGLQPLRWYFYSFMIVTLDL